METRNNNGKKMNYKRIYSQIAKYGKIIPELAEEYAMEENVFIERIKMGLDPKLFSNAIKANERNIKHRQSLKKNNSTKTTNAKQEEQDIVSKKNQERVQQNYRSKQSEKDKVSSLEKKRKRLEELKKQEPILEIDSLEKNLKLLKAEFLKKNKVLKKPILIFLVKKKL